VEGKDIAEIHALPVQAASGTPTYCRISGVIQPEVAFEVSLPEKWNGRFYMIGNGGHAGEALDDRGRIAQRDEALKMGFAFAQTNTGHDSRKEPGGSFVMSNPQKAIDYAYRAVHVTAATAKDIVRNYYARPATRSYWNSCSNGGRQGLLEAQRYPDDFDGVLANAPWVSQTGFTIGTLWNQRSVEYKGNALTVYALAKIRLDQALADKSWTAAPNEQKGDYQNLPPAVILDLDETAIDNSPYEVWMLKTNQTFSTKTWNEFCAAQISRAIPGAVEFTKLADSKGVKVFYVSNRATETEKDTRANMEKLGFPMGGNVDTFLMQNEKPEWGSAKSTRRAVIAKDYRVLLNFGDNFGDFDDRYRLSEADRLKAFDENKDRWGREWLMLANPTYGSFETAPFGHDFKKAREEQRKAKWDVLEGWAGPKQ